jgi:2-polyprenyl-3-methyl-5-hydroxy-6-metoxy-1,4-benzoquinol methylase
MSMLMNVLRSVLSNAGNRDRLPVPPGAGDGPDAVPVAQEPEPDAPPAWRLLDEQTGVQALDYGEIARPTVQNLFGHAPRRLLDIGCASGAVGAGLKQSIPGLWVWGCELNERSAQVAASRLDHVTAQPRAEWGAADLERVRSVDTVLLLDVLEHMYNPWAELEFLATSLSPDAQVIVSLPNIGHISVLESLANGAFRYQALGILDVTHVRFFTFAEMLAMFEQTGFDVTGTWILSRSPNVQIDDFPAQVGIGKVVLSVEDAEEWERLNAIQFGFRLRPRAAARTA